MEEVKKGDVLLKVDHLHQYFKMGKNYLKAVDDVSFDIKKGEVFGLVGESGCGKTTTGRSIIKLYDITGGDVYFKGKRIASGTYTHKQTIKKAKATYKQKLSEIKAKMERHPELSESFNEDISKIKAEYNDVLKTERASIKASKYDHKNCDRDFEADNVAKVKEHYNSLIQKETDGEKKKALEKEMKDEIRRAKNTRLVTQIQMIFQDPIASLDPRMTVKDIIAEGLVIQGEKDKEVIQEKVFKMLEKVGLVREHATRYPHEFSGGQRQRIGVARSLIMNPELIIADEPVSALDVSIQAQVINLLNDVRKELGLTVLFIAHNLSVVKYFSDRIGVMYFGKMVELASSEELFLNPLHPYTRSLLSAIPQPDPRFEKQRKRIVYNPLAEHDYSVDKPSMMEVKPGHFVYCNKAEFEEYKKIIK